MNKVTISDSRAASFRTAIAQFINERREAKQKGVEGEDAALTDKYEYSYWLADAARRVSQIQAVTHVLKATHPDARGSSLYVCPHDLPQHTEIGTHALGNEYAEDIVGNAAALDVYKFLKLEVDGARLLDWFLKDDPDLLAALHDDKKIAQEWAAAFKGLVRSVSTLASHEKAKQVYWCRSGEPTNDADFHLLEPLFPSALIHAVHAEISDARFGDGNIEARHARRDKKAHNGIYRDYRGLVARKLGGTKPQNISQLNSERGGVNYLLASLPPAWRERLRSLHGEKSVFPAFARYEGVGSLIKELCEFLKTNPKPIMETRQKRESIEEPLGYALAAFGLEMQQRHLPGWSREEDCELPYWARLWLDPNRINLPLREDHRDEDAAFIHDFVWKDWPDEVATAFAYWINAILHKKGLPVGDAELKHWARQAIVEVVDWPAPMQRRLSVAQSSEEVCHD